MNKFSFKIHQIFGIAIAIPIIIIALTGAILVYQDALAPILYPNHYLNQGDLKPSRTDFGYDQIISELDNKRSIDRIFFPTEDRETIAIMYSDENCYYFYDSISGKYQASMVNLRGVFKPILALHRTLMIPKIGALVVGIITLIFWLLILITGVIRFFPRGITFKKKLFKIRKANFVWSSHRVLGLLFVIPLLVLGITGNYFTFPKEYRAVISTILGEDGETKTDKITPHVNSDINEDKSLLYRILSTEEIFEKVKQNKEDGYRCTHIIINRDRNLASIRYEDNRYLLEMPRRISLSIDTQIGEVTRRSDSRDSTGSRKVLSTLVFLHMGKIGVVVVKFIWFTSGILCVWFSISGLVLWIRKRK